MKSKRFLVTGGHGFIGRAIVERLVKEGHFVRTLDNDSRGSVDSVVQSKRNLEKVIGDIRDPKVVLNAAQGVDSLIHLAFINGTQYFYTKPALILDVAVRGMLNVIDTCKAHGIRELFLASSSEVYQKAPVIPTDETVPLTVPDVLNPRYSYGGGKIISELLTINNGRTDFDRVIIFRPHNVYGPQMGWEHVLPELIMKTKALCDKNKSGPIPLEIQGDGKQTRSFVEINDFVDAFMLLLEKGEHMNIYHIGTQEEVTIRDIAEKVIRCFNREPKISTKPAPPGETPRRCPNIDKLKKLGFKPKITLDEGIPPMVDWYVKNPK